MTILERILAAKRGEVEALRARWASAGSESESESASESVSVSASDSGAGPGAAVPSARAGRRSLVAALRRPPAAPVRVLAEVKRASPSAGPIRPGADPAAIARAYAEAGAAAISVLTDRAFFDGDLAFLAPCRAVVDVPVLRKDFLIDPLQVAEARAAGADAVLLIVAALAAEVLAGMMREVRAQGLEALVEVHSLAELDVALAAGATLLGVNHRDLRTFAIDMTLTEQIARRVPVGTVLVAESGIRSAADVRRMGEAGAHAVLVGEHLMRAALPGDALRELLAREAR